MFLRPERLPVRRLAFGCWLLLLAAWVGFAGRASAALQFDVWLGYDGISPQASWFPVTCEIYNDGPAFTGHFVFVADNARNPHSREVTIELPTGTRKRFVVPVFATMDQYSSWNAYLRDEKGKVRGERLNLRLRSASRKVPLLGAIPRTFSGLPPLPEVPSAVPELQPAVARLQVEQFPDHPIALEGLAALYLNTEKALELKAGQVAALLAWVHAGGHLLVNIEQPSEVNATPWLRNILPCQINELKTIQQHGELQQWVNSYWSGPPPAAERAEPAGFARSRGGPARSIAEALAPQPGFDQAPLPAVGASAIKGEVLLEADGSPLIIQGPVGRGKVTVVLFGTELEPFRAWKNRPWFWARVIKFPHALLTSTDYNVYGSQSIDGVFGALIDSKQVRKLPVAWLLLILVVYLLVIGPFDQFWLKRINRQMLTWITFPLYVAFFSAMIYFIGYKLRAGENEWNELHIVDLLPRTDNALWRGRTYASIYSSANQRYQLGQNEAGTFGTFRGEFHGWNTRQEAAMVRVEQRGNTFAAEIDVPVWTSLLYVNDWVDSRPSPLAASLSSVPGGYSLTVQNQTDRNLVLAHVAIGGRIYPLGSLAPKTASNFKLALGPGSTLPENLPSSQSPSPGGPPGWSPEMRRRYGIPAPPAGAGPVPPSPVDANSQTVTNNPGWLSGIPLTQFVQKYGQDFPGAVAQRGRALGDDQIARRLDPALTSIAASFMSYLDAEPARNMRFIGPPGLEISNSVETGDAVLLAWTPNHSFKQAIYHFSPKRLHRDTLLRLFIPQPVQPGAGP